MLYLTSKQPKSFTEVSSKKMLAVREGLQVVAGDCLWIAFVLQAGKMSMKKLAKCVIKSVDNGFILFDAVEVSANVALDSIVSDRVKDAILFAGKGRTHMVALNERFTAAITSKQEKDDSSSVMVEDVITYRTNGEVIRTTATGEVVRSLDLDDEVQRESIWIPSAHGDDSQVGCGFLGDLEDPEALAKNGIVCCSKSLS